MKNKKCEKRCRASRGLSTRFLLAAIFPIALSISSCCATKQIAQESRRELRDSVVIREVHETIPVKIPESRVEMEIPVENLRNLPEGSSYSEKSGQANVVVKYVPQTETVFVYATCDSLQILCENLLREMIRIRWDAEKEKTEIRVDNFRKGFWVGVISLSLLAMLIGAAWITIKRKLKIFK